MVRSKRSFESPPEFFADRCLGKEAPRILIAHGWAVRMIADEFPDDAQQVGDDQWMAYGAARGWVLLSQDDRIRRNSAAVNVVIEHAAVAFCLDSAQLTRRAKADRFLTHAPRIHRAIRRAVKDQTYAYYVVHHDKIERKLLGDDR